MIYLKTIFYMTAVSMMFVLSFALNAKGRLNAEQVDKEVIATLTAPSIKTSDVPVCMIGLVEKRQHEVGVSDEAVRIANDIHQRVKPIIMQYRKKVIALQNILFDASLAGDLKLYKKTLQKLSVIKLQADLYHQDAVQEGRQRFSKQDVAKIDAWLEKNRKVMFAFHKL